MSTPVVAPTSMPRTGGVWYYAVVLLSFGILTPVPFWHAAARLGTRSARITAGVYTAVQLGLVFTCPPMSAGPGRWGDAAVAVLVVALVHLTVLRRQVWRAGTQAPAADPALAAALSARQRRAEARRILATDPLLARELRIGQPDLARRYDDGGLVDLNSAPAQVIAHLCGIEVAVARLLVEARQAGGPFARVEDVFAWADVPYHLWERIRDRAVVLS